MRNKKIEKHGKIKKPGKGKEKIMRNTCATKKLKLKFGFLFNSFVEIGFKFKLNSLLVFNIFVENLIEINLKLKLKYLFIFNSIVEFLIEINLKLIIIIN